MKYTIKEVSEILGISSHTLRYYDKQKLLPLVERDKNNIRLFSEKDLQWIYLIQCLRKTNMPLKEIKNYIYLTEQGYATVQIRRNIMAAQRQIALESISELENQIDIIDEKIKHYDQILSDQRDDELWNPLLGNPKKALVDKIKKYNHSI